MAFKTLLPTAVTSLLWVIGLIGISSPVYAANFYWRPMAGGPYGKANGTSYANAWHTAQSIDWRRIKPKDILYVCGLHDNGYGDYNLTPPKDATGIVIDGNCPNNPGTILAAGQKIAVDATWKPVGDGVLARPGSGCTSQQLLERQADGKLKRLMRIPGVLEKGENRGQRITPSLPYSRWSSGSFFQSDLECRKPSSDPSWRTLYYKPTPGAVAIYTAAGEPAVGRRDVSNITVRNLTALNALGASGAIEIRRSDGVRVENNKIYWSYYGINIFEGSSHGVATGNEIHDSGHGIYQVNPPACAGTMNRWAITHNRIHDLDQEGYYQSLDVCEIRASAGNRCIADLVDSHAIALDGSDNVVEHNILRHIGGSGVMAYQELNCHAENNLIRHNVIEDVADRSTECEAAYKTGNATQIGEWCATSRASRTAARTAMISPATAGT